ncbi:peptidoglycan-binding domain-containing protein [Streptomyces sp. CA-251387]|uniref:peptidoglycan-binding domain-containing protein n=1 Tax=Streptomyces sp. CA-251387 TaxID=3240064 RepID=UPI003D923F30
MSEPNAPSARVCPDCGTPRASDGTPACSCGRAASDARREARTAEAAAAEDFDPVRIRPFVELGDDSGDVQDRDDTPPPVSSPTGEPGTKPDLRPGIEPGLTEVPQLDEAERDGPDGDVRAAPRRGRRTLLITVAAAVVAVLLTGAFVGGLFSYDSPSRDGALPDDVRAPVPDGSAQTGNSPGEQPHSTSSASASASPTPSPSTTPTDTSAGPTRSATPTGAPSSPGATGNASPTTGPSAPEGEPPVLRFGDQGPEVTELQLRLRQIGFYGGDADGDYDREVENAVRGYQLARFVLGDESGVYGRATRTSLESETSEP